MSNVLQSWAESGQYWNKYGPTIRAMFEPVGIALMEAIGTPENRRVLDVAAGIGEPSLTIARKIPSAEVWCTDAVWPMIKTAQNEATRAQLPNVRFAQCVADALPLRNDSFDGVVCRFGVMFFPDPLTGVREMLRVLKSGCRASAAVWRAAETSPFHSVIAEAIAKYIPAKPSGPDDPNAYRFAPPGKLAAIFTNAGASHVSEHVLRFTIEAKQTPEEFWQMRAEMSEANRDKLAALPANDRTRLDEDVVKMLARFFSGGMMRFPAEVLIVTGTNR